MIGSWIQANSQSPKWGHLKLNWTNLQDLVLFLIRLLIVKNEKKKKKKASNIIKLKNQDFWIQFMHDECKNDITTTVEYAPVKFDWIQERIKVDREGIPYTTPIR